MFGKFVRVANKLLDSSVVFGTACEIDAVFFEVVLVDHRSPPE